MPYNRKAFGIVISKLRVQKGMTQEQLSGLAGIARSHLATLENGEKTVRLDTLWRIAEALGGRAMIAPANLRDLRPDAACALAEARPETWVEARLMTPIYLRPPQAERQRNLKETGHE